jgi:biopolymer transport protein ExbB/TolQ
MDYNTFMDIVNNSVYFVQAVVAIYGTYCAVVILTRIQQKRFKTYDGQSQFLDVLEEPLARGDFDAAQQICEDDRRAIVQLGYMAIVNRKLGLAKVRDLVLDYFQREVLSDLERRLSGINIAIKTEPMLGLLGTVLGMMQAFGKLAVAESVKAEDLASDISFALITTCVGLVIAIPLMFVLTAINVRMRAMQDLVANGLGRFFEIFQLGLAAGSRHRK